MACKAFTVFIAQFWIEIYKEKLYNRYIEKATGTLPPDPAAVPPKNHNEPGRRSYYSSLPEENQGRII